MAREETVEENGRGRRLNAAESQNQTMYLVKPSYAEPHKKEIKEIRHQEKATLCSDKTFQKVFENVDFNIAFSNSKNIKKIIIKTKLDILLGLYLYAYARRLIYVVMETN